MFFDEGLSIDQVVDAVGRQQMFQFEPPDAGGVRDLEVEIVVYLVVGVDDLDAEGFRISEDTIVYPFDLQVFLRLCVPAGLEDGGAAFESSVDLFGQGGWEEDGLLEGCPSLLFIQGDGVLIPAQSLLCDGHGEGGAGPCEELQ